MTLHHCPDNTMPCGSSLLYRQHNAMWLFITAQTIRCNVVLHCCTDNTVWLFITAQTTHCNVALHHCTDNTKQCIQPSMHNNTFFWYLFIFHRQIIDELTFLAQKVISGTQARHRIQHLPEVDNQICACFCCLLHTRTDT